MELCMGKEFFSSFQESNIFAGWFGLWRNYILRLAGTGFCLKVLLYHRQRILETSTLSCNEEEEGITKPPTR
jgi:hypothetical protein